MTFPFHMGIGRRLDRSVARRRGAVRYTYIHYRSSSNAEEKGLTRMHVRRVNLLATRLARVRSCDCWQCKIFFFVSDRAKGLGGSK